MADTQNNNVFELETSSKGIESLKTRFFEYSRDKTIDFHDRYNTAPPKRDNEFWLSHPFGRGIASGIGTNLLGGATFASGCATGALSGVLNVGMYPAFHHVKKFIDRKVVDQEMKEIAHTANYTTSVVVPWATSYAVMKRFTPTLLPPTASLIFLPVMTLFVGYANRGLVGK